MVWAGRAGKRSAKHVVIWSQATRQKREIGGWELQDENNVWRLQNEKSDMFHGFASIAAALRRNPSSRRDWSFWNSHTSGTDTLKVSKFPSFAYRAAH